MNIEKLTELLPQSIDAALIITPCNRRYFTGFPSSDGFLLVTRKGSIFFTDSRYIEAARKAIKCCDTAEGINVFAQIRDYLNERQVKTVALEASGITLAQFGRIKDNESLKDFEFICDSALDTAISILRMKKSEAEVKSMKEAQAIAEKGFLHILNFIKKGRTEKEIQLELDYFMLRNGGEALSFETIAVSGVNSSMPHGVPTDKEVQEGDFITMDFGSVINGCHSDMTRTVAVGYASDEQKEVYETVLKAQKAALSVLKAGLPCAHGDKAARDVIEKAGYGSAFGHSTGHGVGLEIHELPNLSPKSKMILETGNVVTVEPGIYLPGRFGVRIEDMAYITDTGCENLTAAEKSLIIL